MSVRLRKRLRKYGVQTLGEVVNVSEDRFQHIPGVGQTTMDELRLLQRALKRGEFRLVEEKERPAAKPDGMAITSEPPEPLSLSSPLESLSLSTRLRNRLTEYGCTTLQDLGSIDRAEFTALSGVGNSTLHELDRICKWVSRNVPGCEHISAPQGQARSHDRPSGARKALRRAAINPELGLSPEQLEIVTRVAPGNDYLFTLSDVLCDVVERVTLCHSAGNHERDAAIWLDYYRVLDGRKRTLRALGRAYSLTGGRVQQLVARVSQMSQVLLRSDPKYSSVLTALQSVFGASLGAVPSQEFPVMLQHAAGWTAKPSIHHIRALAHLLEERPEAFTLDHAIGFVRHSQACSGLWSTMREQVQIALREIDQQQHILDFAYDIGQRLSECACPSRNGDRACIPCCGARAGRAEIPESYLRALLSTFSPCPLHNETVFSAEWTTLKFGTVKWAALEAGLRILGKPAHYSDLAQLVRENSQRWHDIDDRNVLSTLMNDHRFIATGARGTYGLREWGVPTYATVADRVETYLRDRGRPAPVWKIIDVLVTQDVPEANIRACLYQQRFRLYPDGTAGLTEWEREAELAHAPQLPSSLFRSDSEDHFIMG